MTAYDGLRAEFDDFISMLAVRQHNADETLNVIRDARNGIGLSKSYSNTDDLMQDLNSDD